MWTAAGGARQAASDSEQCGVSDGCRVVLLYQPTRVGLVDGRIVSVGLRVWKFKVSIECDGLHRFHLHPALDHLTRLTSLTITHRERTQGTRRLIAPVTIPFAHITPYCDTGVHSTTLQSHCYSAAFLPLPISHHHERPTTSQTIHHHTARRKR